VRELPEADGRDGRNAVRSAQDAAHRVVRGLLDVRLPEGRHLGAGSPTRPRDRLVPNGVGDAPPPAPGARTTRPGPAHRHRRGRRDVLRRRGAGRARRPPEGEEVPVVVAVERKEPHGFGCCRMTVVKDASAGSLQPFVIEDVEPGATVVTDGWPSYLGITGLGYVHEPHSHRAAAARGEDIGNLLPGVHRVASLAKRWVLGTHQGSVGDAHLQSYLNEFVFRFNRRTAKSRGLVFYRLLQLAVEHDPVRYRQLVADSKSKKVPPVPPWRRGHPPSLDRARANRPWRTAR